jgi:signal transduction histidine kinase
LRQKLGDNARAPSLIKTLRNEGYVLAADTGGTGLGLPIAANLLAAQGGTLSLHNRPDGGLEARVRLPAKV